MILFSHFKEIRARLSYTFLSIGITFLVSYVYSVELLFLIIQPFNLTKDFIFLDVPEAITTLLILSALFTIHITLPFILYQGWCFFIPGLFQFERTQWNRLILLLFLYLCFESFLIGWFIIPQCFHFFSNFQIDTGLMTLHLEPRISTFLFFIYKLYTCLLLLFQFPLGFLILCQNKILSTFFVTKYRKYCFYFLLLLAAFFSPPDFFSQTILFFVILVIYEVTLWIGFLHERLALP